MYLLPSTMRVAAVNPSSVPILPLISRYESALTRTIPPSYSPLAAAVRSGSGSSLNSIHTSGPSAAPSGVSTDRSIARTRRTWPGSNSLTTSPFFTTTSLSAGASPSVSHAQAAPPPLHADACCRPRSGSTPRVNVQPLFRRPMPWPRHSRPSALVKGGVILGHAVSMVSEDVRLSGQHKCHSYWWR